jgi:hypothetical protein
MKNGKGEAGLVREDRLQIMLSPEELKAVDNQIRPSHEPRCRGPRTAAVP